jgi:hypothetical protein
VVFKVWKFFPKKKELKKEFSFKEPQISNLIFFDHQVENKITASSSSS